MMTDSDLSLLSHLKTSYPSVPLPTLVMLMKKYENDQEKCRQALETEVKSYSTSDFESFPEISNNNNNNKKLESTGNGKSVTAGMKELQVSHRRSTQPKPGNQERHISTIERSIGSPLQPPGHADRPHIGHSLSWTVRAEDGPSPSGSHTQGNWTPATTLIPPQMSLDLSSFFSRSATDIPNITCRTFGDSSMGSGRIGSVLPRSRGHQVPVHSASASGSPVEQRHPVKVINIPTGSHSGGYVSSAAAQSNPHSIRMNFGDSGGICLVSTAPSLQRYGSTPNISQHYRSEIRTEAPTLQPMHSSSMVLNTSSHTNHLTPGRKPSTCNSINDIPSGERRTPNLPLSLNTGSFQTNSGPNNVYSSGKLSTPVEASSPGIAHSKPVFVDVRTDRSPSAHRNGGYADGNYLSGFYPEGGVRPPLPASSNHMSHQNLSIGAHRSPSKNNTRFNPDFPRSQSHQEQLYPHSPLQQKLPAFHSSTKNLHQPASDLGQVSTSYPQLTSLTNLKNYPLIGSPRFFPDQTPHTGQTSDKHLSRNPSIGTGQPLPGSRSNSQDSEHDTHTNYDELHNSLGYKRQPRVTLHTGIGQDDDEYTRALVQHQRRQIEKLKGEMNQHWQTLNSLRFEVGVMEKNMLETGHASRSFPSTEDISGLFESNRRLQTDIQLLINEIDMYRSGQIPFNKISPQDQQNFFENMPTGQQDPVYTRASDVARPTSHRPGSAVPVSQHLSKLGQVSGRIVPGSVPAVSSAHDMISSTTSETEEGEPWSCTYCTFSNHPALKKCEMCEIPRLMPYYPAISLEPPARPPLALPLGSSSARQPPALPLGPPARPPPGFSLGPPACPPPVLSMEPPFRFSDRSPSPLVTRRFPGPDLVGGAYPRSRSPHSVLGYHHHQADVSEDGSKTLIIYKWMHQQQAILLTTKRPTGELLGRQSSARDTQMMNWMSVSGRLID